MAFFLIKCILLYSVKLGCDKYDLICFSFFWQFATLLSFRKLNVTLSSYRSVIMSIADLNELKMTYSSSGFFYFCCLIMTYNCNPRVTPKIYLQERVWFGVVKWSVAMDPRQWSFSVLHLSCHDVSFLNLNQKWYQPVLLKFTAST